MLIAQAVLPRSCEPIHPLPTLSRTHLSSKFAAAYPDNVVDERFAGHWYDQTSCVFVSPLLMSLKVDMVHPGRRGQPQRCWNKHSPHSRKHARCRFSRPYPVIVPLARLLDRRALGQSPHRTLPSWGNEVSGLFSSAHVPQL
jgi:hypothetical protein